VVLLLLAASYGVCFGLMNEKVPSLNRFLYWLPVFRQPDFGTNFFSRMFECSYCTGFHTGWVVWVTYQPPLSVSDAVEVIWFAFASSVFCYSADTILQHIER